ncbi:hypothetical protein [Acaryochloris marina]|uniref:hypothetical protein n=1 Tax=Acaryochloris marina TaxID=155978 RepID=UPI001BAFFAAF|nr:hypothetical protein [Acaryochloris marina]QUY42132.1 hypothetical protein I1H34_23465 [Acaryochloris marina S15]
MCDKAEQLIRLAENNFTLMPAEVHLLEAVVKGEAARFCTDNEIQKDSVHASKCAIRASLIIWLCTDSIGSDFLTYMGINIIGAKIQDSLNLNFLTLEFPIILRNCIFLETIRLERAKIKFLDLSGCYLAFSQTHDDFGREISTSLEASGIEITSDCLLCNGFTSTGRVALDGARIGGNLVFNNGEFYGRQGYALTINNGEIQGNIIGESLKVNGGLSIFGTSVNGSIECCRSIIFGDSHINAILATNICVKGSVRLDNACAFGRVSFHGSNIGNSFSLDNAFLVKLNSTALDMGQSKIKGVALLGKQFLSIGEVNFNESHIGGNLGCDNGKFFNPDGYSLSVEQANVSSVFLRTGFQSSGQIRLIGTTIRGSLDCHEGQFKCGSEDCPQYAILAQNTDIKGSVFLNQDFKVIGGISLNGAKVGANISCRGGTFNCPKGSAICAQQILVNGSVLLTKGFLAIGKIDFSYANISNAFELKEVDKPEGMFLYFLSAKIQTLADREDSWPSKDRLFLDGLVYDKIHVESPRDSQSRLQWLALQPSKVFSPQPYEQLAKVFKESGFEQSASEVLIRKQDNLRAYGDLSYWARVWNFILGHTIAHGYRPNRVLVFALKFVFIGTIVFSLGSPDWGASKIMSPAQVRPFESINSLAVEVSRNYPVFNPLIYSLDTFVPIIDLHQQKYWLPNSNKEAELPPNSFMRRLPGSLVRWYLWIHITVGWIVTSLWVAGFTGLVRRLQ